MVAMQAEVPIRMSASCRVQGDVVLECIHIADNLEHKETMMFRVMFNTAFILSNVLGLNRDDIDVAWNVNNPFPRDFRAEVINAHSPICFNFHFISQRDII
jgi:hypothetical protein